MNKQDYGLIRNNKRRAGSSWASSGGWMVGKINRVCVFPYGSPPMEKRGTFKFGGVFEI